MNPSNPIKLILVAGARPNFMKIAPIIKVLRNGEVQRNRPIEYKLVHTGQHYDIKMSEVFFEELDIPSPDINLEVGSASHAVQTANIMTQFEQVCLKEKPDWVVVVGDVNSTMACTLVASKIQYPPTFTNTRSSRYEPRLGVAMPAPCSASSTSLGSYERGHRPLIAHVEAGLRSFDRTMPEEINRIVTDSLADILFTPSTDGNENLIREGIPKSKIKFVGNIMIDTLVANLEKARNKKTHVRFGFKEKDFVYVTLHRPSNVDDKATLSTIMDHLDRLSSLLPVCFPVHPRTRKMLATYGIACGGNNHLKLIDPIGYHDSICLAEQARFVLTDSGGLQEETTFFKTPCLTLRPNTERPITITEGSNKLTNIVNLWADIESLLNGSHKTGKIPDLWDGHTAERIVETFEFRHK